MEGFRGDGTIPLPLSPRDTDSPPLSIVPFWLSCPSASVSSSASIWFSDSEGAELRPPLPPLRGPGEGGLRACGEVDGGDGDGDGGLEVLRERREPPSW